MSSYLRQVVLMGVAGVAIAACGNDNGPKSKPTVLFGVTAANQLVSFEAETPGTVTTTALTGLGPGEQAIGLDFRPDDEVLYLATDSAKLYTVDPGTGAATFRGAFTPIPTGSAFGFDINPVADRIRVAGDDGQNFRVIPATGGGGLLDSDLSYATGDANEGEAPEVIGGAQSNNRASASSSALFLIDAAADVLTTTANPNLGELSTLGPVGIDVSGDGGFDIAANGTAYAALVSAGSSSPNLYTVNLSSGLATLVGPINSARLVGLSAQP